MIDWHIQARAHRCQSCENKFQDREPYHTLLFEEKTEYRRHDICEGCWREQYSEGATDRKGFVSHWKGIYHVPPPPREEAIQKNTAEALFRELAERNDPNREAALYILAVMLERKRILKVKDQFQKEGRRVFLYEQPKTGDLYTVTDPQLQLDQLQEVQMEVAGLLEHGLNPSPESEASHPEEKPEAVPDDAVPDPTDGDPAEVGTNAAAEKDKRDEAELTPG